MPYHSTNHTKPPFHLSNHTLPLHYSTQTHTTTPDFTIACRHHLSIQREQTTHITSQTSNSIINNLHRKWDIGSDLGQHNKHDLQWYFSAQVSEASRLLRQSEGHLCTSPMSEWRDDNEEGCAVVWKSVQNSDSVSVWSCSILQWRWKGKMRMENDKEV